MKGLLSWSTLECESTGLANISRIRALKPPQNTVYARVVVEAEEAQTVGLAFGYSDRVRVFLNDRLLYTGDNGYRTRDYRYLGTIGYFDELALPLRRGRNEIWLAVSETFGGWVLQAALESTAGIKVLE